MRETGNGGAAETAAKKIWMTLTGLPLTIRLEWPFHKSTSGADFWVLHGDIRLENPDGLHAAVAVNLSMTVREVMPSLEPMDAEAPVINALRKEVDRRQIEFVKSGKLLPVAFSSRHYDFKRQKWVFGRAGDDVIAEFVARKVYWETRLALASEKIAESKPSLLAGDARNGAPGAEKVSESKSKSPPSRKGREKDGAPARVWICDPTEAQYLQTTPEHLLEIAGLVAGEGLIRMDGECAGATAELMEQASRFETAMRTAVEELEKKYAFERG
ncbi:MAG TPA: hypothetical protein VKR60_15420 [Candidatus Sulfotelmatobacter sp.]|nr:hypothetical protein [Candidatus Sulfotelmatobacter sp.]